MITRQGESTSLACDECGDDYQQAFCLKDFDVLIASAKADRWTLLRENGDWKHFCPDCKPEPGGLAQQRRLFGR